MCKPATPFYNEADETIGRRLFQESLGKVFKIRDKQQREHKATEQRARLAAERPDAHISSSASMIIRSPSLLSPFGAQSGFSNITPSPTSPTSTNSTISADPLGIRMSESQRTLSELPANPRVLYELDGDMSVVLNNFMA